MRSISVPTDDHIRHAGTALDETPEPPQTPFKTQLLETNWATSGEIVVDGLGRILVCMKWTTTTAVGGPFPFLLITHRVIRGANLSYTVSCLHYLA